MTDPVEDAVKADIAKAQALLAADAAQAKSKLALLWAKCWPLAAALAVGFLAGLLS